MYYFLNTVYNHFKRAYEIRGAMSVLNNYHGEFTNSVLTNLKILYNESTNAFALNYTSRFVSIKSFTFLFGTSKFKSSI